MRGLKILFAINNLRKGGAQRLTLDICREFNRRNVENLLVTFSSVNEYPELSSGVNIKFDDSRVYLKFPLKAVAEVNSFEAIVNGFKPDVIHSHLFYSDHISRQVIHHNIAYFSHIHGRTTQYEPFSIKNILKKKALSEAVTRRHIIRKYLECSNQFIANSTYVKEYIIDSLKWKPEAVHLLPNAIG